MNTVQISEVTVTSNKGLTLADAIAGSIEVCRDHKCNVVIIHNDKKYRLFYNSLCKLIDDVEIVQ